MRKVILGVTAMFLLLFAANAQAHNVSANVVCGSVTLNWSQFSATGGNNNGLNSPSYEVVFTPAGGGSSTTITGIGTSTSPWAFPGTTGTTTVAIPEGNGSVYVESSITPSQTRDRYGPASSAETFTLSTCQLTPTLTTTASGSVAIGGQISDTAHLTGATPSAGGTITFRLYGPNDASCSGPYTSYSALSAVSGSGDYPSQSATVSGAGTWRWRAFYSGDANNNAVSTACNDANESVTIPPSSPSITTNATVSSPATVGATLQDVAHLSGVTATAGGSITFKLYGPNDTNCSGTPVAGGTIAVSGPGAYDSSTLPATAAGSWQWIASYSGDANNSAVSGHCGDANEGVTVAPTSPSITTNATVSSPATIGATLQDVAHLSGVTPTAGGSITFKLYGPNDSTCSGTPVGGGTIPVSGPGAYDSNTLPATAAGSWQWIASYSGDANNSAVSGHCGDANEGVTVAPTSPSITTNATVSSPATVGATLQDVAHLSGVTATAGGSITFKLYGPNDTNCSGTPVAGGTIAVSGPGAYDSSTLPATAAGSWQWIASYSGDANNSAVSGHCGDANEGVTVAPTSPSITTNATVSSPATIGATLQDVAHLSGVTPTAGGSITFKLYGPNDSTCSGTPVGGGTIPVSGPGAYDSNTLPATAAGSWQWIASYSGDANNSAVSGHCGDANEGVTVAPTSPSITTNATVSSPATVGATLQDVAHLSGVTPTAGGSITFKLYGPNDSTCSGTPVAGGTIAVSGPGAYDSNTLPATAAGSWQWIASYSGDANNSAVSGHCGDANEGVTVAPSTPSITTTPSGTITLGGSVSDSATLSGGSSPTGTISFALYGNASCSGTPAFTSQATVNGNGSYASGSYTPTGAGVWYWTATYGGDPNNNSVASECGSELVVVTNPATPSFTLIKEQMIAGSSSGFTQNTLTANVGQQVLYEMIVTNTGNEALALTSFTDPHCDSGTLTGPAGALDANGNLAPGHQLLWTCSHIVTAADAAADPPQYVNTVTVVMHPPGQPDLPPQTSTVIVNIPRSSVLPSCTESNSVVLHGPTGGVTGIFDIRVSSAGIKSVSVYIDGKHYKTATGTTGGRYIIHINPKHLSYGGHKITIKTTPTADNCTSVARSLNFVKVKPAVVTPKFTG